MPGYDKSRYDHISIETLRACFDLQQDGNLIWKVRPRSHFNSSRGHKNFNTQFAGKIAGTRSNDGYVRVVLFGKTTLGHHIVFAIHNGRWPDDEIDHRDLDRTNSTPSNLREAGPMKNSWNHSVSRANTSGFKGVTWTPFCNRWRALLRTNGKRQHLGYFDRIEDAVAAYERAVNQQHGDFARVR